jgi:hypothetical protein
MGVTRTTSAGRVRSQELSLGRYNTDKVAGNYLNWYDSNFRDFVDQEVTVLELGIRDGGSLLLWRDYFPKGTIVGIDQKLPAGFGPHDRIKTFEGSQDDVAFLSRVASEAAPCGFDIIIDDASHIGELTKIAFWHLFDKHLKPSGIYAIEDWGTGYWEDWADGKRCQPVGTSRNTRVRFQFLKYNLLCGLLPKTSFPNHGYGMVGFIKQLVDEQGASDLSRGRMTHPNTRNSKFEKMVINPSVVFITKSAA